MTPVATGIHQLHIRATDLPRATAFYRDVVGLPFLFESNGMAFFQCGPTRLMLSRADRPELDHPSSMVYFATDDIETGSRTLRDGGAPEVGRPHVIARLPGRDVWLCDWKDSEGNVMCLMEERRAARS
jgi:methylmalonyl-CoA/ethylmalonyl-CoA epimerase